MLEIHSLTGGSELIPNVSDLSIKESINQVSILKTKIINSKKNEYAYPLISNESYMYLDQTYTIKQLTDNGNSKSVVCTHLFFDNIGSPIDQIYPEGLYNIKQLLDITFNNIDWEYVNLDIPFDVNSHKLMPEFGNSNVISVINTIVDVFDCEFVPDIKTKTVYFAKRLGRVSDFQLRYRHNIETISRSENTDKLYTAVKVYYNQDEYGTFLGYMEYISPNANLYPNLKWAESIELPDIITYDEAYEYTVSKLTDTPEISIKITVANLMSLGYDYDDVQLGDMVLLYDNRMNINEYARIVEIEKFPFSNRSPIVTISNVKKNIINKILEQKEQHNKLDKSAVKQRVIYNGCTITPEDGFKATAHNGVVTFLNATEGIAIINNGVYKFYVNTDGELILDGRLKITGNGHTLFDGYLDENGGKLDIFDIDGKLNVRIGSNYYKSNTTGGALTLYSDGDDVEHERVESYIDKDSDTGALVLRGRNGVRRLSVNATSSDNEMTISISDVDGRVKSMFSETYGLINGDTIITDSAMRTYVSQEISDLRDSIRQEIDWLWDEIDDLWNAIDNSGG